MSHTLFGATVAFEPADSEDIIEDDVDDALDDVLAAVEKSGVPDEDWSWVVWRYDLKLYFLISGPVSLRAKVAQIDGFSVKPANDIVDYMDRQSNEWVFPRPRRNTSILDRARNWFREQLVAQFSTDDGTEEIEDKKVIVEKPSKEKTREQTWLPSRVKRGAPVSQPTDEDLDRVRAVLGKNDEEGRSFIQVG